MWVRTVYEGKILHCEIPVLHRPREMEARIEHDPFELSEKAGHTRAFGTNFLGNRKHAPRPALLMLSATHA